MSISAETFKEKFPEIAKYCGSGELEALLASLETRKVLTGQSVATDGEYSDSLFFVTDGCLVSQITSDNETIRLGSITQGDCFGEVNILDPGPSTSTVIATEDSSLLALSNDAMCKLDAPHPEMTGNILRMLSVTMIDRCRAADKLLFSKFASVEKLENDKPGRSSRLLEWGRDVLQKIHGHKGIQQ